METVQTNSNHRQRGLSIIDNDDLQDKLLSNYQLLQQSLSAGQLLRNKILPKEVAEKIFEINGYLIGKDVLIHMLQEEFAQFDMLEIRFALPGALLSDESPGKLGLLFRGVFPSSEGDVTENQDGELTADDPRFSIVSETAYFAGRLASGQTPDPSSYPNPPYSKPPESND